MKPTTADLGFYRLKTTPHWAAGVTEQVRVTIDGVVNSHAPKDERDKHFKIHNLMVVLKMKRRNRGLKPHSALLDMIWREGQDDAVKRIAMKWQKRIFEQCYDKSRRN